MDKKQLVINYLLEDGGNILGSLREWGVPDDVQEAYDELSELELYSCFERAITKLKEELK